MSCNIVSDLTISAIVAAMADCDFEPAGLKDEKPFTLGEKYAAYSATSIRPASSLDIMIRRSATYSIT